MQNNKNTKSSIRTRFAPFINLLTRSFIVLALAILSRSIGLGQEMPVWQVGNDGFVNVSSLYSGEGPVDVILSGTTTTYPEGLEGFTFDRAPGETQTLTLKGNYTSTGKPDSALYDVAIQLGSFETGLGSVLVLDTDEPSQEAKTIFEQSYTGAFKSRCPISGYGTVVKTGSGTWMTTANNIDFEGNTEVRSGMFVIGESGVYGKEDRVGSFLVNDGSTLVFCGGVLSTEPVLNVDSLTFASDSGQGGAGLVFNVVQSGQRLASIRSNTVGVGDGCDVWYDGIGLVVPGGHVTIRLETESNGIKSLDGSGSEVQTLTGSDLAAAFSRPLVSFTETSTTENGRTNHILTGTVKSVRAYAASRNLTSNQRSAASTLDNYGRMISSITSYKEVYPAYEMYDMFYNEKSASVLDRTLANMSQSYGVENFYAMLSHFGTAGSPFFNGDSESGNSFPACGKMFASGQVRESGILRGRERDERSEWIRSLWAKPFYSTRETDGNGIQDGFKTSRIGVMCGFRSRFDENTRGGLLFAWSAPKQTQSGSLIGYVDRYESEMKMNDFQFAVHMERKLWACCELSVYLGGGTESAEWSRAVHGNIGFDRCYTGETSGNTLTATVYLSRPFQLTHQLRLTPMIGFDSEHAWLSDFHEKDMPGPKTYPSDFSRSVLYSSHQYYDLGCHRNMARVGLTASYTGPNGGFNGLAFYGRRLGGDDRTSVRTSCFNNIFIMDLEGLEYDENTLNMGVGAWRRLGVNMLLSGHYNFNYGDASTEHNVGMAFHYAF